jgi:hypothetical protein
MCASGGLLIMLFIVIPLAATACGVAVLVWSLKAWSRRQERSIGRVPRLR